VAQLAAPSVHGTDGGDKCAHSIALDHSNLGFLSLDSVLRRVTLSPRAVICLYGCFDGKSSVVVKYCKASTQMIVITSAIFCNTGKNSR